jgi:hypothetical protein
VELPAWLAVIEHVPSVNSVTVTPDTVQTAAEFEANATVNPDVELALKAKGEAPKVWPLSVPNVIVWPLPVTANVCVTDVAAA